MRRALGVTIRSIPGRAIRQRASLTAAGWAISLAAGATLIATCGDDAASVPLTGSDPIALVGVTVIDVTGGETVQDRTILIEGGRIEGIYEVDEAPLDPDTQVLDLTGSFAVPGLVDTHAHMPSVQDQSRFLRNLLGFGVTTARSTAAAPSGGTELRSRIAAGDLLGPRFLTAGRLIDGPGSIWDGFASIVETEDDIRAAVRGQAAQGVDVVKLYTGLTSDLVRAAIDEAHSEGLPVLGHLGRTAWTEAVTAGIDALTHGCFWGLTRSVVPRADSVRFDQMFLPGGSFGLTEIQEWPRRPGPRRPTPQGHDPDHANQPHGMGPQHRPL